ncbi:hypothetical protein QUB80_22990 [Chlorogloeopsis sp. ULAP01]|jgi:hypothetical protein|uniref:hypothetical protein n=1 Tax=Chlorogloeopsis TaxID=1123 RepID=UPI0019F7A7E1|nr:MULTISPECIES: hypothetical protein [Chlorogloeopsis]MBF2004457.1 hypothetical protein [Chlorogloeopsis fritschii C42_A2020_084]MDM9383558.1 hypothetical protein [Chlorogloeopsis sp. ULAP01]
MGIANMEEFSIEELTSIALIFKEYEKKFPEPKMFIEEIRCGITFDRESSGDKMVRNYLCEHNYIDEDKLVLRLCNLLDLQPGEFNKLYLAMEKFWEVEVVNPQERLKQLKLIPV